MNCPICQSSNKKQIFRLCSNMKILGGHFPDSEAYLSACEDCGLVYCDSAATQDDFLTYYTTGAKAPAYYEMFGKDATDKYYEHILQVIEKYIHKDSRILDVASAWGELPKYISERGYDDITALDPCESCNSAAAQKGLYTALTDSVKMARVLAGQYDLIIFNHTLEHILDIDNTMINAYTLLKSGGHIFIEIPDAEEYVNQDCAPYNFLTYEHVLHLTQNDIYNIASRHGFEVIQCGKYYKEVSKYPSIVAVLRKSVGTAPVKYSSVGRDAVERYIDKSKRSLHEILVSYELSQEPLILWGIGASTAILLEAFSGCNVAALIDSNPTRQGLGFVIGSNSFTIADSSTVSSTDGTIFILSIPYRDSIEKQIREMGLSNKIVSFA